MKKLVDTGIGDAKSYGEALPIYQHCNGIEEISYDLSRGLLYCQPRCGRCKSTMTNSPQDITRMLQAWSQGDEAALKALTPLVYEELRRIAHRYMGRQPHGHTLQTSALVNEAYLRLVDINKVSW